jgi:hypothetical protein
MSNVADRQAVMPDSIPSAPAERFAYSYGVKAKNTLYESGLVSFNADGCVRRVAGLALFAA